MYERERAPEDDLVARALRSPSRSLDAPTRSALGVAFGHDLADVRLHEGSAAAEASGALSARAFTVGRRIVLGRRAAASDRERLGLVAHEVAHAVTQPVADAAPSAGLARSHRGDAVERDADARAHAALTGAAMPPAAQRSAPVLARQEIEVDLQVPTPTEAERLRARGIRLPAVSAAAADPRMHSDWIERRLTAVGFGIYAGGYYAYCDGLPLPIFISDAQIDFGLGAAAMDDPATYPDRAAALAVVPAGPPVAGAATPVRFYRGAGGAVIAPTVFSPATTPQFIATALAAQQDYLLQARESMNALAIDMVKGKVMRAVLGAVAGVAGRLFRPRLAPPPPGGAGALGRSMALEMKSAGFRGNPFREIARRLNDMPRRLSPQDSAEAIAVATRTWSRTMGTMPPVQQGGMLVVPSRAEIVNAPVMGIRADGTVTMGRAPRLEIVKTPAGVPVYPPQAKITGPIVWE